MHTRSPRNKTIHLTPLERLELRAELISASEVNESNCLNSTILGDCCDVLPRLPSSCAELVIIDPPYNLSKKFGSLSFTRMSTDAYVDYLRSLFKLLVPLIKPTGTIYVCGDWRSSTSIDIAAREFFHVRGRITWEREKGRGAARNWKNSSEDVWFCTVSDEYTFNVDAVKLRRKVIAPYTKDSKPKDWVRDDSGLAYRDTHPSNIWTDITVPFWSMAENTDHPTQKPEKFCAKLILASSNLGDVVLSPFLGAGGDSVVAKKLGRNYIGIELQEDFALIAQKRLNAADNDSRIVGYADGVFWQRNAFRHEKEQMRPSSNDSTAMA